MRRLQALARIANHGSRGRRHLLVAAFLSCLPFTAGCGQGVEEPARAGVAVEQDGVQPPVPPVPPPPPGEAPLRNPLTRALRGEIDRMDNEAFEDLNDEDRDGLRGALQRADATLSDIKAENAAALREVNRQVRIRGRHSPNIILIVADDIGFGDLGSYGQQKILTPRLDQLAAEGVRFTQFYAGSPISAASRATLLSGLHTGNLPTGPAGAPVLMPPQVITLAETLWQAHYHTYGIGRWGLAGVDGPGLPNRQGFDHWFGYLRDVDAPALYPTVLYRNEREVEIEPNLDDRRGAYANDLFTQEALNFLDGNTPDPQKPQRLIRDFPIPPPFFLYIAYPQFADLPPRDLAGVAIAPDAPYSDLEWTQEQHNLAAGISRLDAHVGAILDKLDERGLAKNTIVIFTSANGPAAAPAEQLAFFNRLGPYRGGTGGLNEGGIHVPLIIRAGRGGLAGTVTDQLGAHWDLFPTSTQMTEAFPVPGPLDGVSMQPVVRRQPNFERNPLYWQRMADGALLQAARIGKWKGLKAAPQPVYFDLLTDPDEDEETAPEPAVVSEQMEAIFAAERE